MPPAATPTRCWSGCGRISWWGQIVGGHGTGKSSLLRGLDPGDRRRRPADAGWSSCTTASGGSPAACAPRPTSARPPCCWWTAIEQLAPWNRFRLKHFCRRRGLGLVVASHRTAGLPPLCQTAIDAEAAWPIVAQLQQGYCPLVTPRGPCRGPPPARGRLARGAVRSLRSVPTAQPAELIAAAAGFVRFSSPSGAPHPPSGY